MEHSEFGKLTLKRSGALTDIVFRFGSPAVVGRFDPSVGPIDIDLATVEEGAYVSRKHAKFEKTDEGWKVTDLGSSNGTFILRDDFERVEEALLTDGCELAFGNARFVFSTCDSLEESQDETAEEAEAPSADEPADPELAGAEELAQ